MKTVGSELVYGLKDGKLLYIDEAENGLDCGCVCPSCGKPLIARQGQKNAHHFAHRGTNECEYVKQTNIHCMAEEIFLEEKEIYLPPIIIDEGNTYSPVFHGGKASIDSVELEKRISDFIPDIVLNINGVKLLVEIYVTHAVDEEKKAKVINGIRRISKPGLRKYTGVADMPRVRGGLGTAIISTSHGVMTDRDARKHNVGGEIIAYVW